MCQVGLELSKLETLVLALKSLSLLLLHDSLCLILQSGVGDISRTQRILELIFHTITRPNFKVTRKEGKLDLLVTISMV